MFTGLIEEQGRVLANIKSEHAHRLLVQVSLEHLCIGESIAVNGVCLTLLKESDDQKIAFDVSPETLKCTALGQVNVGDCVNLERAMRVNSRFGGHYVTGHVDATAELQSKITVGDYVEMTISNFSIPSANYLIPKGSITLDGVSLTINEVQGETLKVLLIPHTLTHTTLGERCVGERFNVEFDYLARVIAHQSRLYYEKSI